jgi:hypothetical protein
MEMSMTEAQDRRERLEELSPIPRIDDDILIVMLRTELDACHRRESALVAAARRAQSALTWALATVLRGDDERIHAQACERLPVLHALDDALAAHDAREQEATR